MTRSRRRTTKWNLIFHYFTVVYAIISGIVLIPLYLKYIPLELYGGWLAATNVIAWLSIVDPGLSSVVMQRVSAAYGNQNPTVFNGLVTNSLILSALLSVLVLILGIILSPLLFQLLNIPQTADFLILKSAFTTAVLGTALMILSYGITAINQGLQSSLGIGLIFSFVTLSSLALTVWLLMLDYGLMALPLALVYRGLGLCVGNAVYLIWRMHTENTYVQFNVDGLRDMVTLLFFTFWGKAASGFAANMDAILIARYLGPEAAPVLILTRKAPDLSRTFIERPSAAFMPAVANLYGSGNVDHIRAILLRLFRFVVWLLGLACVGFLLLNEIFVKLWVGQALFAGSAVNNAIVIGLAVMVLMNTLSNTCYALGNVKGNSMALLAQSLLSIPLIIVGVEYFGMLGVVLSPVFATLIISGWYYPRIIIRLLLIPRTDVLVFLKEIFIAAISSALVYSFLVWSRPSDWFELMCNALLICILYGLCLFSLSQSARGEIIALAVNIKIKIGSK